MNKFVVVATVVVVVLVVVVVVVVILVVVVVGVAIVVIVVVVVMCVQVLLGLRVSSLPNVGVACDAVFYKYPFHPSMLQACSRWSRPLFEQAYRTYRTVPYFAD